MTQHDFIAALRAELHVRATPFDGGALESFAASMWPLVEDDALVDVQRWTDEFLTHQTAMCERVQQRCSDSRDALIDSFYSHHGREGPRCAYCTQTVGSTRNYRDGTGQEPASPMPFPALPRRFTAADLEISRRFGKFPGHCPPNGGQHRRVERAVGGLLDVCLGFCLSKNGRPSLQARAAQSKPTT